MHALLTHFHCGLNNIIKNDHQRAHCKQITLVGAWRANSAKGRTRSEAICGSSESESARSFFFFCLFSADIYTRISLTSGGDAWAAAEGHVLPDEELCFCAQTSSELFGVPGKLFINSGCGSVSLNLDLKKRKKK